MSRVSAKLATQSHGMELQITLKYIIMKKSTLIQTLVGISIVTVIILVTYLTTFDYVNYTK